MATHANEKQGSGANPSSPWHPTVTFMLGLLGGLGVGVLCFQVKLDNPGAGAKGVVDLTTPPAVPSEKGRTLYVEGFDETRNDLPASALRTSPKPTPLRVRLEGKPEYPRLARQARLEGPVDVTVVVDGQGQPTACSASTGNLVLRQAALEAAETWRFYPATRLGRPMPGTFLIHFEFRLHPSSFGDTSA